MAGITSAFNNSFRNELPQAIHNFTITTGHVFKNALFKATVTGTYGLATTNYSDMTGNSDEVASGAGYTTGGFAWTAAQNVTPTVNTNVATWGWSVNPSWTSATFSTDGCLIYNSSASNKGTGVFSFGSTQSVSSGTLTLVLPSNTSPTLAILRLA